MGQYEVCEILKEGDFTQREIFARHSTLTEVSTVRSYIRKLLAKGNIIEIGNKFHLVEAYRVAGTTLRDICPGNCGGEFCD